MSLLAVLVVGLLLAAAFGANVKNFNLGWLGLALWALVDLLLV